MLSSTHRDDPSGNTQNLSHAEVKEGHVFDGLNICFADRALAPPESNIFLRQLAVCKWVKPLNILSADDDR